MAVNRVGVGLLPVRYADVAMRNKTKGVWFNDFVEVG
jgi:hypothetical protein